ncbi:unnamed protein product, partial [Closterium sp. Naga37s-1]
DGRGVMDLGTYKVIGEALSRGEVERGEQGGGGEGMLFSHFPSSSLPLVPSSRPPFPFSSPSHRPFWIASSPPLPSSLPLPLY